jgi:hypothetical protein
MQSSGCQQRNTPQGNPASQSLAWSLAVLRPIPAFRSSDPRWTNLPGVAAYLVGHPRPRSADRAPPLIKPSLFRLVARRECLLRNVHVKTKARRRVGPSERA